MIAARGALTLRGFIALPAHELGGFDHAAVDRGRRRLIVAHTANHAADVIDTREDRWVRSIEGLKGAAGAWVDEARGLAFTSNRGEDTVAWFPIESQEVPGAASAGRTAVTKVTVGARPNGLALDGENAILLSANIGDPERGAPPSVTLVEVRERRAIATLPMPGRTRWTLFDPLAGVFYVNLAEPAEIVVLRSSPTPEIHQRIPVPARGPHGLEFDPARGLLYCACDDAHLVALDPRSGRVKGSLALSGAPDVIFLDAGAARLYVAIGDPGVIDVVDVERWKQVETVATERGAHTLALDDSTHRVYSFLPASHRAAVYQGTS